MWKKIKKIFIAHRLDELKTDSDDEYLAHMLCLGGTCKYCFDRQYFELHAGDLSIIRKRKMIERVEASDTYIYEKRRYYLFQKIISPLSVIVLELEFFKFHNCKALNLRNQRSEVCTF